MSDLITPWNTISDLLAVGDAVGLTKFIDSLSPTETARAISRLTEEEQLHLLGLLSPEDAADMIEDISETQAADLVEICQRSRRRPLWKK